MTYLKEVRPLFSEARHRQQRQRRIIYAIAILTLVNLAIINAGAATARQDDSAFARLTAPSRLVTEPAARDGRRRYRAAGLDVRFVLERNGREASVTFLCAPGVSPCGSKQALHAERGTSGELVFLTDTGDSVLRVTAAGGGTLFGTPSFVPDAVPGTGVAILPY